jgi:hypothetical protein
MIRDIIPDPGFFLPGSGFPTLIAKVSNDREQPFKQRISSLALCLTTCFHIRLPAGNGRGLRGEQLDTPGNDIRWRARQSPSFLVFSQLSYIFKEYFTRYLIYLIYLMLLNYIIKVLHMLLRNLVLVSVKSLANYANPFNKPLRIPSA